MKKIMSALANPGKVYGYFSCRAKPYWYRLLWALRGQRVEVARNFKVLGSLSVKGPGRVVIGDNVTMDADVVLEMEWPEGVLRIGSGAYLNGTRFQCVESITVGDGCILADCRILDADYHGAHPDRREEVKKSPVIIGKNVWISLQCIILKGVVIADGCTVTPASVVHKPLTKANSLYGGNPAVFIKEMKS